MAIAINVVFSLRQLLRDQPVHGSPGSRHFALRTVHRQFRIQYATTRLQQGRKRRPSRAILRRQYRQPLTLQR